MSLGPRINWKQWRELHSRRERYERPVRLLNYTAEMAINAGVGPAGSSIDSAGSHHAIDRNGTECRLSACDPRLVRAPLFASELTRH